MYQLFTKVFESSNSVTVPPEFDYIRRTYNLTLEQIVNYYRSRVMSVASNHFLVKLLNTATVSMEYDIDQYTSVSNTRAPYIAKHFQLTSDINYGVIHPGIFYGKNSKEIILYTEGYFNGGEALANWKDLQPVKVLEHSLSDLSLALPLGKVTSSDISLSTISIDISLLLVMYRGFILDQTVTQHSHLGITHFIHMYVIPNMLHTHIDIVIRNRLFNLYYGAPMDPTVKSHSFQISDYSGKMDRVLKQVLARVKNSKMLYESNLKNIPSISSSDCQEALQMPDVAKTRQVWWALLVSRISTMVYLLEVSGKKGRGINKDKINKLKIDLRRLMNDRVLDIVKDEDLLYQLDSDIDFILSL